MRGWRNLGAKIITVNTDKDGELAFKRTEIRKVYQNIPGTKRITRIDKAFRPVSYDGNAWNVYL